MVAQELQSSSRRQPSVAASRASKAPPKRLIRTDSIRSKPATPFVASTTSGLTKPRTPLSSTKKQPIRRQKENSVGSETPKSSTSSLSSIVPHSTSSSYSTSSSRTKVQPSYNKPKSTTSVTPKTNSINGRRKLVEITSLRINSQDFRKELNHNNNVVLASKKPKSPVPVNNITVRRGQSQSASTKASAPSNRGLTGASSISSLDSKHKIPALNTQKINSKTGSKEKIDKIVAPQKNERTKDKNKIAGNNIPLLRNNNRIDFKDLPPVGLNGDIIGPQSLPTLPDTLEVSDVEIAMQELNSVRQELEIMEREKAALALEVANRQEELQSLRSDMIRMQRWQEQHSVEMEQLNEENTVLRCRLRDVAHSPLSDTEKQQLILDTQRHHSGGGSAPASFALNMESMEARSSSNSIMHQSAGGLSEAPSSCPTPDWDKHSNSSMSEVSVACLQDRILQMEETHYSTNEELQATLQELADLQSQLLELQSDNERLLDEKTVLLESLCRQTEKLEDSRATVDTLQELLIRGEDNNGEQMEGSITDREQKLVDLLKAAQEEREALLAKQDELTSELHELRQSTSEESQERERLVERVRLLESTVDSVHAERKLVDQQLAQAKEESSARRIEISRLTTLLENARAKIDELEKERAQGDCNEMDALLDATRKEKDSLESQVACLQGQVSRGQCEKERLEEQLSTLQEECKVTRNNAKSAISDLEYQLTELRREANNLRSDLQAAHDAHHEAQAQSQRHLEDKRSLKAILAETQRNLADAENKLQETESRLSEEERLRKEENAEWEQFRRDLLMTVRVANDFKTEAQSELEKLVLENKAHRDKIRALEAQIEKLKAVKPQTPPLVRQSSVPTDTQQSVLTSVQQEMAARRQKAAAIRQDSRLSVKSLIESIENAQKQVKAGPGSRSSSTSSLNSIASDMRSVSVTPTGLSTPGPVSMNGGGDWNEQTFTQVKSPLREQQQSATLNKTQRSSSGKNLITDINYGGKGDSVNNKPEDTIRESVALLSAKSIDFVRRNSYGDLSERKDPLNGLVKNGGSKRNALLKWCQQKTVGYRNIDITNFSSSWNDGLALCAILHTYLPDRIPYDTLVPTEKRRNFSLAFEAAESVGIPTTLNISDMIQLERPDWQQVMAYVTAIYKHFET